MSEESEDLAAGVPSEALVDAAQAALKAAAGDSSRAVMSLKARPSAASGAELSAAFEIALMRERAGKLGLGDWTERGLFTKAGLEQSSGPSVSKHHAVQFKGRVLEICTGLGFDTAALARVATEVVSIEASPKLAHFARHNLKSQGLDNVKVIVGRAEEVLPTLNLAEFDGLWADPSRRDEQGMRAESAAEYTPSLAMLFNLDFKGRIGIKVGPAHRIALPSPEWRSEWIGLRDECIEHTVWRGTEVAEGTVTLVDRNVSWSPPIGRSVAAPFRDVESDLAQTFLIEPHAALIRSGALESFLGELGAFRLDPKIAYGSLDTLPAESPFYARFKILERLPFNLKTLNRRLQELEWGARTELKKRGFPETPEELRPKLKALSMKSEKFGVVFFTRVGDDHTVLLAERV